MKSGIVYLLKDILTWEKHEKEEIRFIVDISAPREINLYINAVGAYIDWGDGTPGKFFTKTIQLCHEYRDVGPYQVIISGKKIIDLEIKRCDVTVLQVNKCLSLEYLDCSGNRLTELDVSACRRLYELYCDHNELENLLLKKYDKLHRISCSQNQLKNIELKGCRNLADFDCRRNNLQTLDVSNCRKLYSVNLEWNLLDVNALNYFLRSLVARSKEDIGYVIFRNNTGNSACDKTILYRKRWCEI